MKRLTRAALALCLTLLIVAPSMAASLYTVLVWDPRFPSNPPIRITTTEGAAAALVQAGVATPADPGAYGYLATLQLGGTTTPPVTTPVVGTLDFSDPNQSAFIL